MDTMVYLSRYLEKIPETERSSAAISFWAALDHISQTSPLLAKCIVQELKDQRSHLKLIASENYCSLAVQLAMGNLLTDKYSEGYPGHRFYAGCENIDIIENRAVEQAKDLFGADHAYVQPHSGADANLVAFWSILVERVQNKEIEKLQKNNPDQLTREEYEKIRMILCSQKMMGMSLNSGGHLTHGYKMNVSSKMMQAVDYKVDPETHLLDYKRLEEQVMREKPLVLVAGYSAYPRLIDFAKMREIADKAGAVLLVDMAHFAGLVAGRAMSGNYNPVPFAHIVTSTTHKTLRGPRGGIILCCNEFKQVVDKGCPLVLGGPLPHVMAAKAIAFKEAGAKSFRFYAEQIIRNAQVFARELMEQGVKVLTNGTDNHLILFDVFSSFGLTGRQAETALNRAKLTVNRNAIAEDRNGPWYTSGIRLGTAALTTLGMKDDEMREIARILCSVLKGCEPYVAKNPHKSSRAKVKVDPAVLSGARQRVGAILSRFPLYPELGRTPEEDA